MIEEKLVKLKKYTLLLVEDDKELLNKLQIILEIFFKEVLTAMNGEEALNTYTNKKVDMVIADYNMPIMSGYELFKKIRKINSIIPLVIISSYSDKEKLMNSIPLYLTQYLIKPIEYSTLTQTLISMVERIDDSSEEISKISDSLFYDNINKVIQNDGIAIELSKSEINTIELLLRNKNKIVSIAEIR